MPKQQLTKKKNKGKKVEYVLPEFNLEKLFNHIQECVDKAPFGMLGLVIDLFCGAGGTGEGIEQAVNKEGCKSYVVIAGINHDLKAIYSHAVNHPLAYYSTEDIRTAKLGFISSLVDYCRERWPQCKIILWGSLECTNHSNAKGGMSRDADSRTLAWHLFRYIEVLNPDGIWIENVKEFYEWGPVIEKVVMKKEQASVTICEAIENELEFYNEKINDGWILTCPLDKKKKKKLELTIPPLRPVFIPVKSLKGTYYKPWRDKVKAYGYNCEEWFLNAADYGVPQNRKRFFPIFMKIGEKITKPVQTHAKDPEKCPIADCKQHVPIRTCLNLDEEGDSIFSPGKIKSDESYKRFLNGLIKFVAGGKSEFIAQRNSGEPLSKIFFTDKPSRTITSTGGNQQLVQMDWFITKYGSDDKNAANPGHSIDEPSRTITTMNHFALTGVEYFITKYMGNNEKTGSNNGKSIDEPSNTIATSNRLGLVKAEFIDVIYGNGTPSSLETASPSVRTKDGLRLVMPEFILNYQGKSDSNSLDEASPTVMTKEKLGLVDVEYFIVNNYTGGGQTNSIDDVSPAVTTNHKSNLAHIEPFISVGHFDRVGSNINDPSPTITANRKHHIIINPSYHGNPISIDEPSVTVIARQDKSPLYLMIVEKEDNGDKLEWFGVPVMKGDSETVIKIKEFMALYLIKDIKMRMLMVIELLRIQSFPEDYYLAGSHTDKKKFIGNAVPVLLAKCIAEAMHTGWVDDLINKILKAA